MEQDSALITYKEDELTVHCKGPWTVQGIGQLIKTFGESMLPSGQKICLSGATISAFDSAGALAVVSCMNVLTANNNTVNLQHFNDVQMKLIELIQSKQSELSFEPPLPRKHSFVYKVGIEAEQKLKQIQGLLVLVGDLSATFVEAIGSWRRFQWPSIVSNIDSAGLKALPIVALLSFLIGVVLAYQMGLQLETYGANIFIAYLSGMAIFREFAPLITAIIVAGRTSSAFTAQIGSMKVNEEVDALLTMGLSPTELLILPKVIGLVLIFPLLIFWSDFFSILGSMMMSKLMLDIGHWEFLQRLKDSVGLKQMMLGLYKAPVFALLIALVGCFQGLRVEATADSIGSQTTKSVVQALFLIIIADAAFSIMYSWMGL